MLYTVLLSTTAFAPLQAQCPGDAYLMKPKLERGMRLHEYFSIDKVTPLHVHMIWTKESACHGTTGLQLQLSLHSLHLCCTDWPYWANGFGILSIVYF